LGKTNPSSKYKRGGRRAFEKEEEATRYKRAGDKCLREEYAAVLHGKSILRT